MMRKGFFSRPAAAAFVSWCVLVLAGKGARAFEIESPYSYGCHEHWAQEALDEAGYVGEPPKLAGDDRYLFDAVEFDASFVDENIWAMSLVLGARSNDVGEYAILDIPHIIEIHNGSDYQAAHCLRTGSQDYEEGDADAVESCRDFIRRQIGLAFDAAGPDGSPDPSIREEVEVNLAHTGGRDVDLSSFYFHVGAAMHTLQDSFSNCYRSADRTGIVEAANWIDWATENLDVERDGPGHDNAADDCRCDRDWGQPTFDAVSLVTKRLLEIVSMDASRTDREAALEELLDAWVYHVPGCTASNKYCASPDPGDIADSSCGFCECSTHPCSEGNPVSRGFIVIVLAAIGMGMMRRRS
ncbi:MAG: hypothetical protein ABIJ56_14335 [Pseudomonadota bacterium]